MIPLLVEEPLGVLVISWYDQMPMFFFHRALKVVDLIKKVLG